MPIPTLLAVGAVHQHLLKTGQRGKAALFADCGDVKEVHDVALAVGFGAVASAGAFTVGMAAAWPYMLTLFCGFCHRELLMDIGDTVSDAAAGVRFAYAPPVSSPTVHGWFHHRCV